jgi:Fe-Mn family superoxide dismutase
MTNLFDPRALANRRPSRLNSKPVRLLTPPLRAVLLLALVLSGLGFAWADAQPAMAQSRFYSYNSIAVNIRLMQRATHHQTPAPAVVRLVLSSVISMATLLASPLQAFAEFTLPPLPYGVKALEPIIDAPTMTIHHDRHHAAYVANLNAQITSNPELASFSLTALQQIISRYPASVRNNGGGHYNHSLFWTLMAPEGQGGKPSPELTKAIAADFGSLQVFQQQFNAAAASRFGSGWAWLIVKPDGHLAITSTPNQDNPLMDLPGIERGTPILALDVWEHAYYLKYQNRRPDYISAWWSLVNWNEVNRLYRQASI